jgi:DNA replication protein DnaC
MANATPVLNPELVTALKRLKLGRIAETLPERLVLADKQQMTFDDRLLLVLTDEVARRDKTAADVRAREAGLDPAMRIELWDKTAKVSFDKRMLAELMSLRFLEAHRHVVVLGPVGVGKTFVSRALGHVACRHGYHVRFTRADEMLRTLRQSRFDNSRDAEMIALTSVDLLVLDDFAPEPMSKDIYQHFLERTGRASMIVSSNRDTAEWLGMFDGVLLAQSAVDRFKNAAYDFVIEGESYRPRPKPKLDDADPPPPRIEAAIASARASSTSALMLVCRWPDCSVPAGGGCMTLQNFVGSTHTRRPTRRWTRAARPIRVTLPSVVSTHPSGCMTLPIG